jgi:DNA-nicking Smr family endonuclease
MPDDDGPFGDDPVEIPIEDSIDLHYFPPSDVGAIVDAYLEAAAERGFREVRIIHGRGRGVQRHRVHQHLARNAYVERFEDAPGDRGGWGATLVWLRRSR